MISLSSEPYIVYILSHSFVTLLLACIWVHLHLLEHLHWLAFECACTGLHLPSLLACIRECTYPCSWPALECTCTGLLYSAPALAFGLHLLCPFWGEFFSCFWMWSGRWKMQSFIMMKPASDQSLDFIFCYWLWYFLVIFPSGFADFIKATTSYSYTGPVLFYFNI